MSKANPQCDGVCRWGFGEVIRSEGGALMMGLVLLRNETLESFLPVSAKREDTGWEPGRGLSADLDLGLPTFRPVGNKCPLFRSRPVCRILL